jgi:hypothetical protein
MSDVGFGFDNVIGLITWDGKPIAGIGLTGAGEPYNCSTGIAVRDAVYLSGSDTIDLAQADVVSERPVIGFVLSKPTSTSAIVQYTGEIVGFSGLTPGATYWLSETPGQITTTAPITQGSIVQEVGWARNATTLVINVNRDFVVL